MAEFIAVFRSQQQIQADANDCNKKYQIVTEWDEKILLKKLGHSEMKEKEHMTHQHLKVEKLKFVSTITPGIK